MDDRVFQALKVRAGSLDDLIAAARMAGMPELVRDGERGAWRVARLRAALQDEALRAGVRRLLRGRPGDPGSDDEDGAAPGPALGEAGPQGELDREDRDAAPLVARAAAPDRAAIAGPERPAMAVPERTVIRKLYASKLQEPVPVPASAWRDFEIPADILQLMDAADDAEAPQVRLLHAALREVAVPRTQIREKEFHPVLRQAAGKTTLSSWTRLAKNVLWAQDVGIQAAVALTDLARKGEDPQRREKLEDILLASLLCTRSLVMKEAIAALVADTRGSSQDLVPVVEQVEQEVGRGQSFWGTAAVGGLSKPETWVERRFGRLGKPERAPEQAWRGRGGKWNPSKRPRIAGEAKRSATAIPPQAEAPQDVSAAVQAPRATRGRGGRGGGGGRGR